MSDKELITTENINAMEVFADGGIGKILEGIKARAMNFVPDISTDKGRKEIASMARKVASSKVLLDNLGKDLVSDWKAKAKLVDESRKLARDTLDNLRDAVRLPLTEWEEEKAAKEAAEALQKEIEEAFTAAQAENELFDRRKAIEEKEAEIQRHAEEARAKEEAAEQERARAVREELIRKEAEEKARQEAAQREAEAKEALEKAGRDRVAAAKQAEIDKENAIKDAKRKAKEEAERKEAARLASEAEAARQAAEKAANKEHRAAINNAVLKCLIDHGMSDGEGKELIRAIAVGEIAHITINY